MDYSRQDILWAVECSIRILHISDLHERGPRERERFRRERVLGDAWKRNLHELVADGRQIDLICFTGDLADWAEESEYVAATAFVMQLLDELKVPLERFFPIPGNHDVKRDVPAEAWEQVREPILEASALDVSRWMQANQLPPGIDAELRKRLLDRCGNYRRWLKDVLKRPELLPERSQHGTLGFRQMLRIDGCPFETHVIGLESGWMSGNQHDAGKLLLTDDQIMRLATKENGTALSGFRLGLIHHPLHDLVDGAQARRLLASHVDLLLRGHLHQEAVETTVDPDQASRMTAAGCLYEGHYADQWPNSCHVIDVVTDSSGRPLRFDLCFRRWSNHGHWHADDSLYSGSRGGLLSWHVVRNGSDSSTVSPTGLRVSRNREVTQLSIDPESLLSHLVGPYELRKFVGSGGSGWVFRAVHSKTGRHVCVKLLYPFEHGDETILSTIERGVRALGAIDHPAIIKVSDFGSTTLGGHSTFYLAMEFVDGKSLEAWSRDEISADPHDLSYSRVAMAAALASALAAAHECRYLDEFGIEHSQLLHGDIKPENVIVRASGVPVVLDFMLIDTRRRRTARAALDRSGRSEHVSTAFGTPGFMAREQYEGNITVKTDIYSLGITLVRLFHPEVGTLFEGLSKGTSWPSSELRSLVQAMVSDDPTERPASMRFVASELSRIQSELMAALDNTILEYLSRDDVLSASLKSAARTARTPGKSSEDFFLILEEEGLFVVADGIGENGPMVARLALETVSEFYVRTSQEGRSWPYDTDPGLSFVENRLAAALKLANYRVCSAGKNDPRFAGQCSIVAGVIKDRALTVAHVGQCRAYMILPRRTPQQLTRDHTIGVGDQRINLRTFETSTVHVERLVRAIGASETVLVDVKTEYIDQGQRLLLCGPGVFDALSLFDLGHIAEGDSLTLAVERIVESANSQKKSQKQAFTDRTALLVMP